MQQDTTGLGIILLNALTEEQWVEEDDFARKLNLPPKTVRKAIRYLEQVWGSGRLGQHIMRCLALQLVTCIHALGSQALQKN